MNPIILFEAIEIALSNIVDAVNKSDRRAFDRVIQYVKSIRDEEFTPPTYDQALRLDAILGYCEGLRCEPDYLPEAAMLRSSVINWMVRDGWLEVRA